MILIKKINLILFKLFKVYTDVAGKWRPKGLRSYLLFSLSAFISSTSSWPNLRSTQEKLAAGGTMHISNRQQRCRSGQMIREGAGPAPKAIGGYGGGCGRVAQHHLQEILIGQPGSQEEHHDDLRPSGSPSDRRKPQ